VVCSDKKQSFSAHLHGEKLGDNELLSLNRVAEAYSLLLWRSDTQFYCEMAYIVLSAAAHRSSQTKTPGDLDNAHQLSSSSAND
jgi:hypothetical protein